MKFRWNLFGIVVAVFLLGSCNVDNAFEPIDGAEVTVIASELDTGAWRVDFCFPLPQSALFFSRSRGDYRTATWAPIGDAPEIERLNGLDALIFNSPAKKFSYEIQPHTAGIPQDYTPFLAFSDGGTAIFTGQFELLSAADREAVEALDGNLMAWSGMQFDMGVRVKSDRPMLVRGERSLGSVEHISTGGGTYVYLGESELQEGKSYIGVIDSALPAHVRENLDQDLAALFKIYEDRWGFALPARGTIYYAFEGYDHSGLSNKGSVLGTDLMILQSSGEGLREPDPDNRAKNLWFFAHEGAHMFQGVVMGRFNVGPDAWIHEGGANTMANSAIQSLPGVPESFIVDEYRTAFESCAKDLERGSLMTAHVDGRFYAHYHCGQIFNAAADAALPDYDLYEIWPYFAARIDEEDPKPAEAFFETLEALGAHPDIPEAIRSLAYEPTETPREDLARLLSISGLEPEFDENEALVSLKVPA